MMQNSPNSRCVDTDALDGEGMDYRAGTPPGTDAPAIPARRDGYRTGAAGPRTGWHQARSYSPGTEGFGCFFDDVTRGRTYRSSSSKA